jgi:uncharacterized membrane protein YadS
MSEAAVTMVLAVTVEALIQYLQMGLKALQEKKYAALGEHLFAILLGVSLCVATNADLYTAFGVDLGSKWVGILLTGIFVSRGSEYLASIIARIESA